MDVGNRLTVVALATVIAVSAARYRSPTDNPTRWNSDRERDPATQQKSPSKDQSL